MSDEPRKKIETQQDLVALAADKAAGRAREDKRNPEPSLGSRFGQIGVLGWATIIPILLGVIIGRGLDRLLSTGVMFSSAFIMLGAVAGMWSAWKWMHRS